MACWLRRLRRTQRAALGGARNCTVTSSPDPRTPRALYEHREVAQSFGSDAERYDRTRPPYPSVLIEQIAAAAPGRAALDVGCGTGIAARQLQAAGCTVLGVEPDPRMAEFARHSGVQVEVAAFEDWDEAGRVFDTVISATAWHWVDPVAGAAKVARVLCPGGLLAVFGNVVFDCPPQVQEAFATAFRALAPDSPFASTSAEQTNAADAYERLYSKAADGIRQSGGYAEPRRERFDWSLTYTRDQWLDQLPTTGALTQLPPDKLAPILDAVGAAIDALGGRFTATYATIAVTAVRTGATP